ncbi:chitinase-related protein 1 [Penaeus vannamei]|uniref:Chitinase-related protein 1 n=1 Tax=Penaeus vannamei TaxID=6689 RepID=A0A3R7QX54_PENVA|nr:chitinase-related protein 1 [Penaeus vannamei]
MPKALNMVIPGSSWKCGAFMISLLVLLSTTPDMTSAAGDKVVCYYASWAHYRTGAARYTVDDVPVELCTHAIYAFAVLDADSLVAREHDAYLDKAAGLDNYRRFVTLRERNPQAKMLLGLGGWTDSRSDKYSRLVSEPQRRAAFVSHVVSFLQEYGFDGLDLDWEYPGYQSSPQDREGFRLWVEELRAAFSPHGLLLTAAVSAGGRDRSGLRRPRRGGGAGPDPPDELRLPRVLEGQVAHHAPLFPAPARRRSSRLTSPSGTGSRGAPASKLDAGTMAYYEICQAHQRGGWRKVSGPDGPHLTHGDQWVGYDDIAAIRKKALYAQQKGLGESWSGTSPRTTSGHLRQGRQPAAVGHSEGADGSSPGSSARPPTASQRLSAPCDQVPPTPRHDALTGGQVNKAECRTTGFTADPSSCSFFYRCSGELAFRYQSRRLHWRQERLACDWPDAAGCGAA